MKKIYKKTEKEKTTVSNNMTELQKLKIELLFFSSVFILDEEDKKKYQEFYKYLESAPIKDYEHITGGFDVNIIPNENLDVTKKEEITNKLSEILKFRYIYIVDKYQNVLHKIKGNDDVHLLAFAERIAEFNRFRASGQFIDNKLNRDKSLRNSISKSVTPKNKDTVTPITDYQMHEHNIGEVNLSPSEDKLVLAFQKLLHLKSSLDRKNIDYYMGNSLEILSSDTQGRIPSLSIKPIELYKAYTGKDSKEISGKEIENIKKTLFELEKRVFEIVYRREVKLKNKNDIEENKIQYINIKKPLIKVLRFYEMTNIEEEAILGGNKELWEQKEEMVIAFNPIFAHEIDTKYIIYPGNIVQRIEDAAGGSKKVTQDICILRDYLLRELSNKRYTIEIGYDNLTFMLRLENYLAQGKKKYVKERIDTAIKVFSDIKLINNIQYIIGSQSQVKIVFTLNNEFK